MPNTIPKNSVGIVTPQLYRLEQPFQLSNGRALNNVEIVYETYGELNPKKNNAILICHALSGDHHAAGYHSVDDKNPGWWDNCIGPGKVIDTNVFYVVCMNNLGGCAGTTGPTSINSETGKIWGKDFPHLRVRDWVHSQKCLMDYLGIPKWAAIVGGSLGGMQAMRWALEYPDQVDHCIVIASSMKLTAQNIAFNETARQAIMSDPDFHGGDYLEHNTFPQRGLAVARMIGHITYLSDDAMGNKFGRELRSGSFQLGTEELVEFQVESYLRYQGEKFSSSFDANTYILMTKALDYFDLGREYNDNPVEAFKKAQSKFLVISFTSDWRFAPERSQEITYSLIAAEKEVCYAEIDAPQGHDAFLLEIPRYLDVFGAYMKRITQGVNA